MADSSNRKPRNYYVDYTKHGKSNKYRGKAGGGGGNAKFKATPELTYGNCGFLLTSVDEVKSYFEMRNVLEEYYESLYGKNEVKQEETIQKDDVVCEDEIESELKELRKMKPFKQVKTHCRNTLFLNITKEFQFVDPVVVVDKLFEDILETKQVKSINTYKVLPIMDTFRISISCAKQSITNIFENRFQEDDAQAVKTYFIEFQSRGNFKLNSEDRQNWIEGIAKHIADLRPHWKVERDNADYMIVLVALKEVCCITFLKDYFKRAKYNLMEFKC